MLILYVGMKYDYGKPGQGHSFEHYNFYDTLAHMEHDVLYFDFMTLMQQHGREWMNRRLLEVVKTEKPDILFCVLFTEELDQAVMREISETETTTVNWFCDDHWRFDDFTCHWASCFNWSVTTAASALPKYAQLGYENVIKSQWGCNHFLYRKLDLPLAYDVTFVGQPHGNRRQIVQALRDAGIDVRAWGSGWESGRLSQEEMIRVFNQSRINLNLANASVPTKPQPSPGTALKMAWRVSLSLNSVPFAPQMKAVGKRAVAELRKGSFDATGDPSDGNNQEYFEQIKGRNFEVPGTGGFMLTGRAENLEDYYHTDKEIACFEDVNDLIDKARYFLSHEDERAEIANSGYERTTREHTYETRFREIFQRVGLEGGRGTGFGEPNPPSGRTREIL